MMNDNRTAASDDNGDDRKIVRRTVQAAGSFVSQLNVARWIDRLEQDQHLADDLESLNQETADLSESKKLVAEVRDMCLETIRRHLDDYLQEQAATCTTHPPTYEDWIRLLHPDNVITDSGEIDARFFVPDSDHLQVWNEKHAHQADRQIPCKTSASVTIRNPTDA